MDILRRNNLYRNILQLVFLSVKRKYSGVYITECNISLSDVAGKTAFQGEICCEKNPQSDNIVDDERCEFAVESGKVTIEPPSE